MTQTDFFYVVLLTASLLFDHFVLWRRFLRQAAINPGGARLTYWSIWITLMWALTVGGMNLWHAKHRLRNRQNPFHSYTSLFVPIGAIARVTMLYRQPAV